MALITTACSSGGGSPSSTAVTAITRPATTTAASATASEDSIILIAGTVSVAAARSFEDPGFHEVVEIGGTIPALASESPAGTLTVSLWDASRPTQTCRRNHPLSGCVTVDWSDAPGRPHVPDGGVFLNQLTLQSTDGPSTFNLSESGVLASAPDEFSPG